MKISRRRKGIALLTVLIFMLLVTIIAGAALSIMTRQARLAEHQIRRIKGFYAAESAINKAYQSLRVRGMTVIPPSCGAAAVNQWCLNGNGTWQWDWNGATVDMFEWMVTGVGVVQQTRGITVIYNPTAGAIAGIPPYGLQAQNVNYGPS